MTRILLAEDDENLGSLLREYLNAKGYSTTLFPDGEKASSSFSQGAYDLCLMDVMMPVMDGFAAAKIIRGKDSKVPIIFLTAKNLKEDVLEGFKLGADDYITKPFSMEELLFRIEAVLRRTMSENSVSQSQILYTIGNYSFDTQKQTLHINDSTYRLTTKESELLHLLCDNANRVLERDYALKTIWGDNSYFNARSMDVYITKLRKYLKEDPSVEILNVHGKGFKLIVG